jgi:hypothetical protein
MPQKFISTFETLATVGAVQSNCNAITIYNQSAAGSGITLIVNGLNIAPGFAYNEPGNQGELNTTVYNLRIDPNPSPAAVIVIERKIYI